MNSNNISAISIEVAQRAQASNTLTLERGAKDIQDVRERREARRAAIEDLQSKSTVIEDKLSRGDVGGLNLGVVRVASQEDSMKADVIRMSADVAKETEAIEDLSARRADTLDGMKGHDATTRKLQQGFDELRDRTFEVLTSGRTV